MTNLTWHAHTVTGHERAVLKSQKACVIWLTGLSGAGKSTIANAVDMLLFSSGLHTYLLDSDNIRHGLNTDLGFTPQDREENIRRISEVSKLLVDAGLIVCVAAISPFIKDRDKAKEIIGEEHFIEVHVCTPLEVCVSRDVKGLYRKANDGLIDNFTGIHQQYEAPVEPALRIDTSVMSVHRCAAIVVNFLNDRRRIL